MRVVSLLPSATELVCLAGGEAMLVGRSHECDFPPTIVDRVVLTAPAAPLSGDSRTIHERVAGHIAAALSVYEVDATRLGALQPDLIVTQDLCEVCAVARADVEAAVAGGQAKILSLNPKTLTDIFNDLRRVGRAIGMPAVAERQAEELASRAEAVTARRDGPTVLALEWIDPVMVGGLWMHEVISLAGGTPLGPPRGAWAETLDLEHLRTLDPDVVLLKPCGFETPRTRQELARLAKVLPLQQWRAAKSGHIFVVDGHAYFNRPGPRIVTSIEVAAACIEAASPSSFGAAEWVAAHGHDIWRVRPDLSVAPLVETR